MQTSIKQIGISNPQKYYLTKLEPLFFNWLTANNRDNTYILLQAFNNSVQEVQVKKERYINFS